MKGSVDPDGHFIKRPSGSAQFMREFKHKIAMGDKFLIGAVRFC